MNEKLTQEKLDEMLSLIENQKLENLDESQESVGFNLGKNSMTVMYPKSCYTREPLSIQINSLFIDKNKADFFKGEFEPGLHVFFGPAGVGKSLVGTLLEKQGVKRYVCFEHVKDVDVSEVSIDERGLAKQISKAIELGTGYLDSLRLIPMVANGYPAVMQGISSSIFVFAQWLSLLAAKTNTVLFAAISTERTNENVIELFSDYLKGGPLSCWRLEGYGYGHGHRKYKERMEYMPFELNTDSINVSWVKNEFEGFKNNILMDPKIRITNLKNK